MYIIADYIQAALDVAHYEIIDDSRPYYGEVSVARAQIERQAGGYACSTVETDFLVDTALEVPGVLGAQLSGAGLGGCGMILAQENAVAALCARLRERYYQPRGLESGITVCVPISGSMIWELD